MICKMRGKPPERLSDGKLPGYAWPGGYPMYYIDDENNVLCTDCANKTGSSPDVAGVNWEDDELYCDDCSKRIESAYAEEKE